jgi:DNA modification methylase
MLEVRTRAVTRNLQVTSHLNDPASEDVDAVSSVPVYELEFWTSRQRQSCSIHEVSYRACFKPELPRYFIERLTKANETVYDPFSGRGTTAIEAALLGRTVLANDVNPLSEIFTRPRLEIPSIADIDERLHRVKYSANAQAGIDLSMFFHEKTLFEIAGLRQYLARRRQAGAEDHVDRWLRMIATNRLTGHSPGFFSVYTLPPNQAVSPENQIKINQKLNQAPAYKDTRALILRKSMQLQRSLSAADRVRLKAAAGTAAFLTGPAADASAIRSNSVALTVTSPPFLDVVQYASDNWLRCWFNSLDAEAIAAGITMSRTIADWEACMAPVFTELYRVTKPGGWVAFEVGEVRKGKIRLDEHVVPLGIKAGFDCEAILINTQRFTKTANIWGVGNNEAGTNSNRIVVLRKE